MEKFESHFCLYCISRCRGYRQTNKYTHFCCAKPQKKIKEKKSVVSAVAVVLLIIRTFEVICITFLYKETIMGQVGLQAFCGFQELEFSLR